ncbi:MAG: DUF4129 domain-containing protein [Polyangiaceae bacterium]
MLTAAAFFLTAHNLLAAANPGAPLLSQDRFAFCHDESFPLTGKDARWCPLVGEKNAVCPSLPAACLKPPTAVDLELTLGGGSGSGDSDDGDGDGQVEPDKEPPDDGDGDAEGRASRGDVRLHLKPGQGGSGDGSGSGNGNGSGNGSGTGNGAGTGTGNGNGSGDTAGDGNSSPNSSGDTPHSGGSGQPTAGDRTPGTPSSDPSAKAPPTPEAPEPPPPPPPPPPPQGLSVFAQVLLFAILGVGLFLLIRAIAKHLSWRKKKDEDADDIAPEQTEAQAVVPERRGPVETDVERLLRRAQEAAARGDFERAVEDAYAALLRRLDGAGLIEIHPSRTNGDYVRALRDRPELRTNVRAIVRDVERVQFGDEAPSANIFRAVFDRVVPIATRAITVLGVIFVASILTSGGDAHARDRLGDTGPYGTAVLDELLEQRGRDVTHRTDPLGNIEDESTSKVLVLLRGASIDKDTWRRVIGWTREAARSSSPASATSRKSSAPSPRTTPAKRPPSPARAPTNTATSIQNTPYAPPPAPASAPISASRAGSSRGARSPTPSRATSARAAPSCSPSARSSPTSPSPSPTAARSPSSSSTTSARTTSRSATCGPAPAPAARSKRWTAPTSRPSSRSSSRSSSSSSCGAALTSASRAIRAPRAAAPSPIT